MLKATAGIVETLITVDTYMTSPSAAWGAAPGIYICELMKSTVTLLDVTLQTLSCLSLNTAGVGYSIPPVGALTLQRCATVSRVT